MRPDDGSRRPQIAHLPEAAFELLLVPDPGGVVLAPGGHLELFLGFHFPFEVDGAGVVQTAAMHRHLATGRGVDFNARIGLDDLELTLD